MIPRGPKLPSLSKRSFLGAFGGGVAAMGASAAAASTRVSGGTTAQEASAGSLNLEDVPVVDSHMHPLSRALISVKYDEQARDFAAAVVAASHQPASEAVKAELKREYESHVMGVSRRIGYFNYVSRVHGVPPTLEGFDHVLAAHTASDAAFADYTRSILDREKIACVVLQSREQEPIRPTTVIPSDRFVWTYRISDMTDIGWARDHGFARPAEVLAKVDQMLQTAVANGCRGFKNDTTYFRPITLSRVSAADAERAMSALLAAASARRDGQGPFYDDPALEAALRTYEDYVFRHIYVRAGELARPIIIHCAVILHPALRPANNDPTGLYDVITDPSIVAAGTRFVLIHTGYPAHHVLAAMNSQFARLYVDVSHLSKYPGALEETLRALIAVGPVSKIMHGSDTGTIPEEMGYCADNTRRALARILSEYKLHYGWRQDDISTAARQILNENARRLFRTS